MHHMDVKLVFLNNNISKVVFKHPPSFVKVGFEHKVCHLHKSMNGLRQFPCTWNEWIDSYL
jgi:hypothetical protein